MSSASSTTPRWLFGPASDLVLGCGLGYVAVFAALLLSGVKLGQIGWMVALVPLLAGTPHYGATLLRVYEKRSERRAYAFFAVWVTLALWVCFGVGLYQPWLGSILLSLSITWGPWHYSAQNYGIAVMFLGRRGVEVPPGAKRALHLTFVFSFLLTALGIHAIAPQGEYGTVTSYRGSIFHDIRLGIPSPWWEAAFASVAVLYAGSVVTALRQLLPRASLRDLAPTLTLVATQALWFSLPPAARYFGLIHDELGVASAFVWVAAGHTIQYLWITTYYAARDGSRVARARFYGKALLAGAFLFTVPALAYAMTVEGTALGGVAFGADVGIFAIAMVNLHHYILDGAVWKMRDGRVARVLIRREPEEAAVAPAPRGWLGPAFYAVAGLAVAVTLYGMAERGLALRPALDRGDLGAAYASLKRLERVHQVNASDYAGAARAAVRANNPKAALRFFRSALDERRSAANWVAVGRLERSLGEPAAARAAFERALDVDPRHRNALYELALHWLEGGDPARALETLDRAAEVAPDDRQIAALAARARDELGGGT